MGKIKTLFRMLKKDRKNIRKAVFSNWSKTPFAKWYSDEKYIKRQYRAFVGKKLNLKNPRSFNEKLQWLKLYNRKPEYTTMVDKFAVKEYIAQKIGEEYIIPTLGVYDKFGDIEFDKLPNQFVLKCTHDSGSVVVCSDKSTFDYNLAKSKLEKALKRNMFWHGREWPYKNVKPRIIAEKYIADEAGELNDYKLMCFNGKVKCSFVCSERFTGKGLHVTFFDKEWNVMPFERYFPSVKEGMDRPKNYDKMIELAESLSKDIPFVRVDFYETENKLYFGELTFFPGNGVEVFSPEEWDYKLGEWIELPKNGG